MGGQDHSGHGTSLVEVPAEETDKGARTEEAGSIRAMEESKAGKARDAGVGGAAGRAELPHLTGVGKDLGEEESGQGGLPTTLRTPERGCLLSVVKEGGLSLTGREAEQPARPEADAGLGL